MTDAEQNDPFATINSGNNLRSDTVVSGPRPFFSALSHLLLSLYYLASAVFTPYQGLRGTTRCPVSLLYL